jgi:alpha-glucuronidase
MTLAGYSPVKVERFETASGETAVLCKSESCTASFEFDGKPGWYTLNVRYFDYATGLAKFKLWVGDQVVEEWVADATLPTRRPIPDGTSSTRILVSGVALRPGDVIRVEGIPDGDEDAALDYVEVLPEHH